MMDTYTNGLAKFFGVAARGQTYLNNLYLFLAFPLGLFYFVFLVSGLAVAVPLVIIWVGLLFLLIMFAAWYGLAAFERQMAIWLLREDIPPMTREDLSDKTLWQKFTATLRSPVTWKGLVYLLGKFPLGVFTFIVQVTLLSTSAALLAAPLYYNIISPRVDLGFYNQPFNRVWLIDTLPEALGAFFVGALLALVSLHILNGLAWVSGKFARAMLGDFSAPAVSSAPPAPEITAKPVDTAPQAGG